MEEQTRWDHCKEIINTALGMAYLNSDKVDYANQVYQEINGDFGIPTESDIDVFRRLIRNLPLPNYPNEKCMDQGITAKTIAEYTLILYIQLL